MTESSNAWLSSDGARDRVTALLEQAGIPLELQVASVCKAFVETTQNDGFRATSERLVYAPLDEPDIYRELDNKASLYQEFEVGDTLNVQLTLDVDIECKHRAGVQYFAFPTSETAVVSGLPLWSNMVGSGLFASLRNSYSQAFSTLLHSTITGITFKNSAPTSIHEEQLIHNTASAIYDFILSDYGSTRLGDQVYTQPMIILLMREFYDYISENNYYWASVIRTWLDGIPQELCREFNESNAYRAMYNRVSLHVPVICVDGEIHAVNWNSAFGIEGFRTVDACVVSVRKRAWPGAAQFSLLNPTAEVPAILTNPDGLLGVLGAGRRWFESVRRILTDAEPRLLERWALESHVYAAVVGTWINDNETPAYRSDLDMGPPV